MKIIPLGVNKALVSDRAAINQPAYVEKEVTGVKRVIPETGRDALFLQGLAHQVERWAPVHGDGLLVTIQALRRYYE